MSLRELKNQIFEIPGFICLILIGFKLSGSVLAANWSWWVVLSPLAIWVMYYTALGCFSIIRIFKELNKAQHGQVKERAF